MQLSIVILNYNLQHFLYLCVDSVDRAISKIDAEIIVIDNASTDGSRQAIQEAFPHVIWIQNTQNVGFAKANNMAVERAKGEFICLLNPDAVVPENTFSEILNFANKQKNLGAVGCQLFNGQGDFLPESKRNRLTFPIALMKLLGFNKGYYNLDLGQNDIGETDVLVGAFMLLKRKTYHDYNGLDEAFFMYGEDIDFSLRLQENGLKNLYYGQVKVLHFKGESALKDSAYAKNFFGAMKIFYKKHFKRNLFRDIAIRAGEIVIRILARPNHQAQQPSYPMVLISKSEVHNLGSIDISYCQDQLLFDETEVTYLIDMSHFSYREVLDALSSNYDSHRKQVKFIPKNASFAVGSNGSNSLGSAIIFETI